MICLQQGKEKFEFCKCYWCRTEQPVSVRHCRREKRVVRRGEEKEEGVNLSCETGQSDTDITQQKTWHGITHRNKTQIPSPNTHRNHTNHTLRRDVEY